MDKKQKWTRAAGRGWFDVARPRNPAPVKTSFFDETMARAEGDAKAKEIKRERDNI